MSNILEDLTRAYIGAKIQREHILNQNGANMVYTHGCDVANKLNLDANQRIGIVPFPSPTSLSVVNPPAEPVPGKKSGISTAALVAGMLGSALLGSGGALGLGYATGFIGGDPAPIVQEVTPGEVILDIE